MNNWKLSQEGVYLHKNISWFSTKSSKYLLWLLSNLFSELIIKQIKKFDLSYSVNAPYSGGFITEHHGNPALNKHAIQIEINRDLYLREDFKISTEAVRELGVVLGDVIQSVSSLC